MFKISDKVRITKTGEFYPSLEIPLGYWAEGKLLVSVEIGSHLIIERYKNSRNPEKENSGLFESSKIKKIQTYLNYWLVMTSNSIYKIQKTNE